jgi:hypothetical protein
MNKANVYNWLKITEPIADNSYKILEMDEFYRFVIRKPKKDKGAIVYLTTLVSRSLRQIVGFGGAFYKVPKKLLTSVLPVIFGFS